VQLVFELVIAVEDIPCLFCPEEEFLGSCSFVEQAGESLPELLKAFPDFRGKLVSRQGRKELFRIVDALFRKGRPLIPAERFQKAQRFSPKKPEQIRRLKDRFPVRDGAPRACEAPL